MKRLKVMAVAISMLAFVALTATGVRAGTTPKTTGSVRLSGPTQYMSFDAFQSNPVKGSVSYTNFEFAVDGTGVWVPSAFNMGFAVDPSTDIGATYAMTVTSFTPTSPTSVVFAGTGDTGSGWISTFTGAINGSVFTLSMTEINASNTSETYALSAIGSIAAGGAAVGTWLDNYGGGRTGSFSIADVGYEVFHYVAPVETVSVSAPNAVFTFVIPTGVPYAGTLVTVSVHDGGSPGQGNDTIGWNGSSYTIVGGNLTVFA